jgi:hypothetical protein
VLRPWQRGSGEKEGTGLFDRNEAFAVVERFQKKWDIQPCAV